MTLNEDSDDDASDGDSSSDSESEVDAPVNEVRATGDHYSTCSEKNNDDAVDQNTGTRYRRVRS